MRGGKVGEVLLKIGMGAIKEGSHKTVQGL